MPPPTLEAIATGPVQPFASVRDDRRARRLRISRRRRLALRGLRRPRRVSGHHARALRRDGAAGRGAAHRPAVARRAGLDPSDRQLDQRRDRPGHARRAARASRCRSPTRAAASATVARVSAFPPARTRRSSLDLDAALFGATGPRRLRLATNLEIFWDRLGWAVGRPDVHGRAATARARDGGPRRIAATRSPSSRRRACPSGRATRSAGTGAALARSRGLLHALRRRARAAADRRRSLRDHERRRRAAPALSRGAAAGAAASCATSSSSATAG